MPGPPPKRSTERRRRNSPAAELSPALPGPVDQPPADEAWHEIARDWYESLARSGQARYYEPSDWQTARVWAWALSGTLASPDGIDVKVLTAWQSASTELLTTEGARRRARLEIERAQAGEAAPTPPVVVKKSSKDRLGVVREAG